MTDEFKSLYDNVIFNHFVYDSSQLEQVRSFAVSDNIEIMVINIDAFRKSFDDPEKINKSNIIHRENDKLNGLKPIELIKETRPIVIIDEPQSVDTTPKSKEAIILDLVDDIVSIQEKIIANKNKLKRLATTTCIILFSLFTR